MSASNDLMSDKLTYQYGEIVFEFNIIGNSRTTSIKSLKDDTLLLFAIVEFGRNYSSKLDAIHNLIEKGKPIGETLVQHGFNVTREYNCNFTIEIEKTFNRTVATTFGQFSDLYATNDSTKELYCQVCEIFCPNFKYNLPMSKCDEFVRNRLIKMLSEHNISYKNLFFHEPI